MKHIKSLLLAAVLGLAALTGNVQADNPHYSLGQDAWVFSYVCVCPNDIGGDNITFTGQGWSKWCLLGTDDWVNFTVIDSGNLNAQPHTWNESTTYRFAFYYWASLDKQGGFQL
jgi:hypothetical protein